MQCVWTYCYAKMFLCSKDYTVPVEAFLFKPRGPGPSNAIAATPDRADPTW